MTLPASNFDHLYVNPEYKDHKDYPVRLQNVQHATKNAWYHKLRAASRPSNPAGLVWKQIDEIRAQNFVIAAEYQSNAVSASSREYSMQVDHRGDQIKHLDQLSMTLYGPCIGSLFYKHGLYGATAYAASRLVNRIYKQL